MSPVVTSCRHCNEVCPIEETEWIVGFGRLCEDCYSRADVVQQPGSLPTKVTVRPQQ